MDTRAVKPHPGILARHTGQRLCEFECPAGLNNSCNTALQYQNYCKLTFQPIIKCK